MKQSILFLVCSVLIQIITFPQSGISKKGNVVEIQKKSVLVLPIQNLSPQNFYQKTDQYIIIIWKNLLNFLELIPSIDIITNNQKEFKNWDKADIKIISSNYHASFIITGEAYLTNKNFDILVEIWDKAKGKSIYQKTYTSGTGYEFMDMLDTVIDGTVSSLMNTPIEIAFIQFNNIKIGDKPLEVFLNGKKIAKVENSGYYEKIRVPAGNTYRIEIIDTGGKTVLKKVVIPKPNEMVTIEYSPPIVIQPEVLSKIKKYEIAQYNSISYFTISPDGSKLGFQYQKNEKWYLNLNGEIFGAYDSMGFLKFSDDGMSFGFDYKDGESSYININSIVYDSYEGGVFLVFSPNGKKYGYTYSKYGKKYININGKIFGGYDSVGGLVFSKVGLDYGFFYVQGGKWNTYVNEQNYGKYDSVGKMVISDDGNYFGFDYKQNEKWNVYIKDKLYSESAPVKCLEMSQDGSKFGYCYGSYIKVDKMIYGPYVSIKSLKFSKNGSSYGFVYFYGGKFFININGTIYGGFDIIGNIVFSENGASFGHSYNLNGKWYININGKIFGNYDSIGKIVFSSDGLKKGFSYYMNNKYYIKIDEITYGPYSFGDFTLNDKKKEIISYIKDNYAYIEDVTR
ncbi:MAG: hypothetical protein HPY53_04575 [Brevinematales bacterium]|nr:hypothetical protein [Brevinematales bacterium]